MGTTKYIKVSEETHRALNALKRGGESNDAVIRRLIVSHVKPILGALTEWMRLSIDPLLAAEGLNQSPN
ncbi:MAG TPA: hypothetical protein VMW50_03065 [Dehalococcoidia bacterium]|nr:hypothetical protein [Dehalococcoidia bacterium]